MSLDSSPTTQDALSVFIQNYNVTVGPARQINDVDYAFSPPSRVLADPDPQTTFIMATPRIVSSTSSRIRITYKRMDLSNLAAATVHKNTGFTTVADIIPQINDAFGINLVLTDYDNAPLVAIGQTGAVVIKDTSLLFYGTVHYTLQAAL